MDVSISIIIPVYNLEKKLRRCLDTVLAQSIENYEVLLVDDGSTDNSGRICEEYVGRDKRFHYIYKENDGVSSARNEGIRKASGDFIAFVDGDDFLREDYLERLQLGEEDLTIGSVYYTDPAGQITSIARREASAVEEVTPENMAKWFDRGSLFSVWTSMFRKSIILDHKIWFDTHLTRGEDVVFMMTYAEHCRKVRFVDDLIYYYVQYGGSSSKKINLANMRSLDGLDRFLEAWFSRQKVRSALYEDPGFWLHRETREYLYGVIKNKEVSLREKYSVFKELMKLPSYTDEKRTFEGSKWYIRMMALAKSPLLFSLCSVFYRVVKILEDSLHRKKR